MYCIGDTRTYRTEFWCSRFKATLFLHPFLTATHVSFTKISPYFVDKSYFIKTLFSCEG